LHREPKAMPALSSLLEPKSIAVVGASASQGKPGHIILRNIIENGFTGAIHPVNPRGGEILSRKAYASVTEIPGELDLVIFVLPRQAVLPALKEAAGRGVRAAVASRCQPDWNSLPRSQYDRISELSASSHSHLHPLSRLGGWPHQPHGAMGNFRRRLGR
jgi:predicted CoA-binding protein